MAKVRIHGVMAAIAAGEQNLLLNSKTLSGWGVTGDGVKSTNSAGFTVVSWSGASSKVKGMFKYVKVKKGFYTFSAFVKKSPDTSLIFWPTTTTGEIPKYRFPQRVPIEGITEDWKRISLTYEVLDDDVETSPRFETPGTAGEFSIYAPKLQRGIFATEWTPAQEDTESRLAAIEAQLGITADQGIGGPTMEEELSMDENLFMGGYSELYVVSLLPALVGGARHG